MSLCITIRGRFSVILVGEGDNHLKAPYHCPNLKPTQRKCNFFVVVVIGEAGGVVGGLSDWN